MQRRTCDKIILLDKEKEMPTPSVCDRRYMKKDGTESKAGGELRKIERKKGENRKRGKCRRQNKLFRLIY